MDQQKFLADYEQTGQGMSHLTYLVYARPQQALGSARFCSMALPPTMSYNLGSLAGVSIVFASPHVVPASVGPPVASEMKMQRWLVRCSMHLGSMIGASRPTPQQIVAVVQPQLVALFVCSVVSLVTLQSVQLGVVIVLL